MAKKLWFEIWVWKRGMEKPNLVAKVKSEGLSNAVLVTLREIYDYAGTKAHVENMANKTGSSGMKACVWWNCDGLVDSDNFCVLCGKGQ